MTYENLNMTAPRMPEEKSIQEMNKILDKMLEIAVQIKAINLVRYELNRKEVFRGGIEIPDMNPDRYVALLETQPNMQNQFLKLLNTEEFKSEKLLSSDDDTLLRKIEQCIEQTEQANLYESYDAHLFTLNYDECVDEIEGICHLYIYPTLPSITELQFYINCYILVKDTLYFVRHPLAAEKVAITDFAKFQATVNLWNPQNTNEIRLSYTNAHSLITLNGGHSVPGLKEDLCQKAKIIKKAMTSNTSFLICDTHERRHREYRLAYPIPVDPSEVCRGDFTFGRPFPTYYLCGKLSTGEWSLQPLSPVEESLVASSLYEYFKDRYDVFNLNIFDNFIEKSIGVLSSDPLYSIFTKYFMPQENESEKALYGEYPTELARLKAKKEFFTKWKAEISAKIPALLPKTSKSSSSRTDLGEGKEEKKEEKINPSPVPSVTTMSAPPVGTVAKTALLGSQGRNQHSISSSSIPVVRSLKRMLTKE